MTIIIVQIWEKVYVVYCSKFDLELYTDLELYIANIGAIFCY